MSSPPPASKKNGWEQWQLSTLANELTPRIIEALERSRDVFEAAGRIQDLILSSKLRPSMNQYMAPAADFMFE